MIRVLVADDARTFRAVLRAILEQVPEIEVVGEAVDGAQAVALALTLRPDVITMDVRMPGKDGLEALEELMTRAPVPVVVVSAEVGPEHQETAFRALQLGAVEVLCKPSSTEPGRFEREAEAIRRAVRTVAGLRLVTRRPRPRGGEGPALTPTGTPALTPTGLPALTPTGTATWPWCAGVGTAAARPAKPAWPLRPPQGAGPALTPGPTPRARIDAVGVVASTGGPPALGRLLGGFPGDLPAALLVVQHIAAGFEAGLVHWLAGQTPLGVKLADHGEPLRPGVVYLAREGRHLTARAGAAFLDDAPPVRGFRPSGTPLFQALAREYGPCAAGLVLTGMGDDGVEGLEALRARGGATFAQGPASSVVYGMPREAARRGAASTTLELDELAPALVRLVTGRP